MIRPISGKPTLAAISYLKMIINISTEQPTEIAENIASTIAYNSSSGQYADRFQRFKSQQRNHKM